MSWSRVLRHIEHGWTLEEAERVIGEWWARGYVHWSEIESRTTRMRSNDERDEKQHGKGT